MRALFLHTDYTPLFQSLEISSSRKNKTTKNTICYINSTHLLIRKIIIIIINLDYMLDLYITFTLCIIILKGDNYINYLCTIGDACKNFTEGLPHMRYK